eukprot:COSAG06_NODE_55695_length_288_cov_1.031746_1_plen_74_part_10
MVVRTRPNCKGAVPTDSANCSRAPSLLVGVWGATARPGGDAPAAIGGAKALKNSVSIAPCIPPVHTNSHAIQAG